MVAVNFRVHAASNTLAAMYKEEKDDEADADEEDDDGGANIGFMKFPGIRRHADTPKPPKMDSTMNRGGTMGMSPPSPILKAGEQLSLCGGGAIRGNRNILLRVVRMTPTSAFILFKSCSKEAMCLYEMMAEVTFMFIDFTCSDHRVVR